MLLTTERLRIVPLTPRQLGLWLHDIPALGKELDCRCTAGSPRGDFRRIVEGQYALAAADPVNHLFHTFWFLILRDGGAVAGSACFKGAADADGRVEIGYGLEKAFEKQGYMTEAVRALCAWAKQQPGVRQLTAETDPDSLAARSAKGRVSSRRSGRNPMVEPVKPGCLPPGKYKRPFAGTAFYILVDPESWIRNSGFPGSGADSWREKLFPTAGRLPQSHSSIPLSVFFIRSWSRKSLRSL